MTNTLVQIEEAAAAKIAQDVAGKLLDLTFIEDAKDIEYETVPTPEWGGEGSYLRFASTDAETGMRVAEALEKNSSIDGQDASLTLLVQCLVDDENNRRVTDKEQVKAYVQIFKRKNVRVVDRCLEAVMRINHIRIPTRISQAVAKQQEVASKNSSGEVVTATSPTA